MIKGISQEEREFLDSYVRYLRDHKAKCSQYCGTYNTEDKDCEIYGNSHPSPSRCEYFLTRKLEAFRKGNMEGFTEVKR